jgi:alpha-glucoside transport system substrate-binding protein
MRGDRLASILAFVAQVLPAGAAGAQDLPFPPGEDPRFDWQSYDDFNRRISLDGQELTVFGPWRGPDARMFGTVLAYFTAASGVRVSYASSEHYEQQIVIDTQAGSPPDIAILPQPGLIADLATRGFLAPLGKTTGDWLERNYAAGASWLRLGTYPGPDGMPALYGFPYKAELKSLVWYVPDTFADAGYAVPETLEDLRALTERIAADGRVPWCIGLGSGGATGWPATDWVEDLLLRRAPVETYDDWVTNKIPFTDPAVVQAIEDFGWFARNDRFVDGGAAAVAPTDFRDSVAGLFTSPPRCYLHRQASFIPSYFPEGTRLGQDADFFYFPAAAASNAGRPVLGSGTLAVITRDGPAARAFIEFLETPIAHELWMAQGSFLTPHLRVNKAAYASDTARRQGEILLGATTFRFDGSDLMPGPVGTGAFWSGMVDYAGGAAAMDVARRIQKVWDDIR